jgi:hypothetical protein
MIKKINCTRQRMCNAGSNATMSEPKFLILISWLSKEKEMCCLINYLSSGLLQIFSSWSYDMLVPCAFSEKVVKTIAAYVCSWFTVLLFIVKTIVH